jgi:hypothetical protein
MGRTRSWLSFVLVMLAGSGGLASCGGAEDAVVQVGQTPVSRTTVGHWMEVLVAGDYRNDMAKPPPAGLVSEPADYGKCVATAKHLAAKADPRQTGSLCRQLYQAVKLQAVNFLTNALWYAEEAREHGETVTSKEIARKYWLTQHREYPAPGQIEHFLTEMHRSKADEYYLIKRNLLATKLIERLTRQHIDLRNHTVALKLAEEWQAKWTARTNCQPGYIASQCRQYKGREIVPAPDNILQQLIQ